MINTKVAILEGRLLSSQSELFKKYSKSFDWLEKSQPFFPANQSFLKSFYMFTRSKQKWLFWRAGFYPANQSNLKGFLKALIGWKKATFVLIIYTG